MRGLGEHVEGVHALQAVPKFNETFQVAGEGARIARDVDHLLRLEIDQCLAGFGVQSSAGWIEHDQVDRFDLLHELGQDHFNRAFVEADVFERVQVAREIKAGRRSALDGDQLAGMGGKETGKKPNPAVKFEDR